MTIIRDIATGLVLLTGLEAWAFVILYHYRTRGAWHDTALGRHLMSFTAVVGAFMTLSLVARLHVLPVLVLLVVALALYASIAYLVGRRVWLMVMSTRGDR